MSHRCYKHRIRMMQGSCPYCLFPDMHVERMAEIQRGGISKVPTPGRERFERIVIRMFLALLFIVACYLLP